MTPTMPQADDSETRLIATLSLYPEFIQAAATLDPAAFRLLDARQAFDKLREAGRTGSPVIADDYRAFQVKAGADNLLGEPEYIAEDAARIARAARRRVALAKAREMAKAAYADNEDDLEKALSTAGTLRGTASGTLRRIDSLNTLARYGDREALSALFLKTGMAAWDRSLGGGIELNTSNLLGARPGMGKTAALVEVADKVSARGGVVGVFSKEMTAEQWHFRMACRQTHVSYKAYTEGTTTPAQDEKVLDAVVHIQATRHTLYIDDCAPQSTGEVEAECSRIKAEHGRIDLIIADHIRLFSDKAESENKRLGAISWAFKAMVKPNRLNSRALVAVQLSRDVEKRAGGDKIPDLSDLRDSGELEENADAVTMLYRAAYYDEKTDDKTAIFKNRKCRNGERNSFARFAFLDECMSFEDLAPVTLNAQSPTRQSTWGRTK